MILKNLFSNNNREYRENIIKDFITNQFSLYNINNLIKDKDITNGNNKPIITIRYDININYKKDSLSEDDPILNYRNIYRYIIKDRFYYIRQNHNISDALINKDSAIGNEYNRSYLDSGSALTEKGAYLAIKYNNINYITINNTVLSKNIFDLFMKKINDKGMDINNITKIFILKYINID